MNDATYLDHEAKAKMPDEYGKDKNQTEIDYGESSIGGNKADEYPEIKITGDEQDQ